MLPVLLLVAGLGHRKRRAARNPGSWYRQRYRMFGRRGDDLRDSARRTRAKESTVGHGAVVQRGPNSGANLLGDTARLAGFFSRDEAHDSADLAREVGAAKLSEELGFRGHQALEVRLPHVEEPHAARLYSRTGDLISIVSDQHAFDAAEQETITDRRQDACGELQWSFGQGAPARAVEAMK